MEDIEKLLESPNIRCIINTSDNVDHLANGNNFIFYNKKNNSFLNYQLEKEKLSFEQHLIQTSQNEEVLLDEILKIKSTATKIYSDVNANTNSDNLPTLLSAYDQEYWDKIISFTMQYYNVEIPKFTRPKPISKKKILASLKDFSIEYEFILKTNRKIGQKFIQLLHDYRFDKVNPANLEIDQLYYPKKLYNYLRNRHWAKGIPQDFITNWVQKLHTNSQLDENDRLDFQIIFDKLQITLVQKSHAIQEAQPIREPLEDIIEIKNRTSERNLEAIPPIENFQEFKNWLLKKIDELQSLI